MAVSHLFAIMAAMAASSSLPDFSSIEAWRSESSCQYSILTAGANASAF